MPCYHTDLEEDKIGREGGREGVNEAQKLRREGERGGEGAKRKVRWGKSERERERE